MNEAKISVKVDGIDEAVTKAEHYVELLKEAKKLADELASKFDNYDSASENLEKAKKKLEL